MATHAERNIVFANPSDHPTVRHSETESKWMHISSTYFYSMVEAWLFLAQPPLENSKGELPHRER